MYGSVSGDGGGEVHIMGLCDLCDSRTGEKNGGKKGQCDIVERTCDDIAAEDGKGIYLQLISKNVDMPDTEYLEWHFLQ
jgi:hypothetical protein